MTDHSVITNNTYKYNFLFWIKKHINIELKSISDVMKHNINTLVLCNNINSVINCYYEVNLIVLIFRLFRK